MTRKLFILLIIMGCYAQLHGESCIEIGIKGTYFSTSGGYMDWYGNVTWFFEPYYGLNEEILFGFTNNIFLRMEVAEIRKYSHCNSLSFNFISSLSIDAEYIPPIGRLISPLVYLGFKYGKFNNSSFNDPNCGVVNHEFHYGLGVLFRANRQLKIVFETQLYSNNRFWLYGYELDKQWNLKFTTLGFEKQNLGIRYTFCHFKIFDEW